MFSRRKVLGTVSRLSMLVGIFASADGPVFAAQDQLEAKRPTARDRYAELGIPQIINASEPFTHLSGAPIRHEVQEAMDSVCARPARLDDVHTAVGLRLSSLLECEAAMVTAGAASGLTLGTAAVLAGTDKAKILALPNVTGLKGEVIIQKAHRYSYDRAVRACGVKLIEVETADELRKAASANTAVLLFNNRWTAQGQIKHEEFVGLGRELGIVTFIDCAADAPPAENLRKFQKIGFDLVTFSGGKGLRGPSGTGILLGRKHLIEAARVNHLPNSHALGRGMKVGHEEMIGLLVAVELCLANNPDPLFKKSEGTLLRIQGALAKIPGLKLEMFSPPVSYKAPHLRIRWDEAARGLTADRARELLEAGSPPILTRDDPDPIIGLELTAWMLQESEVPVLISRIKALFAA
jgi:seryl-tRNA(Sec) selenium transferase